MKNGAVELSLSVAFKLFNILSIVLFSAVVLTISRNEPYLPSLYEHLNGNLFMIFVMLISVSIITTAVLLYSDKNHFAKWTSLPIVLGLIVIVGLPILTGYVSMYGDQLTHIGNIATIRKTGEFNRLFRHYPNIHIYIYYVSAITKLSATFLLEIFRVVFVFVCIILIWAISKLFDTSAYWVCLIACIFIYQFGFVSVDPSNLAYLIGLPLISYLLIKNIITISRVWGGLSVISIIFLWTSHLMVGVIFTICIGVYAFYLVIPTKLAAKRNTQWKIHFCTIFILSCVVGWIWLWHMSTRVELGVYSILSLFSNVNTGGSQNLSGGRLISTLFSDYGYNFLDLIWLVVIRYGDLFILAGLSVFLSFLYLLSGDRNNSELYTIAIFLSISIVLPGIWSILELTVGIVPPLNFIRLMNPVIINSCIIISLLLPILFIKNYQSDGRGGSIVSIVVFSVIVVLVVSGGIIGTYNSYSSPNQISANQFITEQDIESTGWFFNYKNKEITTTTIERDLDRFADFHLPYDERVARAPELNYYNSSRKTIINSYLSGQKSLSNEEQLYLIDTDTSRIRLTKVFSESSGISRSDFERLNMDSSFNNVYSNGHSRTWLV